MAGGDLLTALTLVAPPPPGVVPLPDEVWDQFASENGFEPPSDFRALIDRYGVGGFGYHDSTGPWLHILYPTGSGETFVEQSAWQRSSNKGLRRRFPDQEPEWPMWPDGGGFLTWATSIDGDQIGWLTEGAPDSWATGLYGRGGDHHRFPFGCVEFLYRWFTGSTGISEYDSAAASDLAGGELRFYPARPPDPSSRGSRWTEVTVVLAGIGAGADELPAPPHQPVFEAGLSMDVRVERQDGFNRALDRNQERAKAIVDRWVAGLPGDRVRLVSHGQMKWPFDQPLHWEFGLVLDPAHEEVVKRLVVQLASDLGIGVRECRSLEYDLVWADVVGLTASG